jgi:hypothetical protein
MMFHPYAAWFGWYAPLMQYESLYPRLVKHEPNGFDRSACPRKDRFYPKSWWNAVKTQEQPNQTFQFGNLEVLVFPDWVGHTKLKKVYHVKQKANSNEGSSLDAQGEKLMFTNDKKQQKSVDSNSDARTEGHELENELFPIVAASKPTNQNTKPRDDVPTSFDKISRHGCKAVGKSKKMIWVPKGSTPIKAELITQTSTARPTLKLEPRMTSKVLLSEHTNKKADPWGHDRTWSSQRQSQGQKIANGHQDHWRPHHRFPLFNMPMFGQGDSHPGMFTICHDLGIVLGCTMMSLYILLGLCQSHIHVIDLHGSNKVDC